MRHSLTVAVCISILAQASTPESVAQPYPIYPDLCPQQNTLEVNIHEYTDTGTVFFWLDNAVANVGKGPLHVIGGDTLSEDPLTFEALQVFDTAFLKPDTVLIGTWVFDTLPGHEHFHLDGFAEYSILKYVSETEVGDLVKVSSKVGFCLVDHTIYDETACSCGPVEGDRPAKKYLPTNCDFIFTIGQGISVGWFDLYNIDLEGQFIDITDSIDNGLYWLRSVVDPPNDMFQSDSTNDTAEIRIQIIRDIDPYEDNDSKSKVDAMKPGTNNSANLAACQFPKTIDSLSIHQSYEFGTFIITPDHDWFKFRLTDSTTSSHYVQIDFEHDLGNLELQLLNSDGDTLSPLKSSLSETDNENINLDSLGPGSYYVRVYAEAKFPASPPSHFQINWNYSLTIDAPVNELCGDVNDDDIVSIADILDFNASCFSNTFTCEILADVDGCCPLSCTLDLWYLIAFFFQSGPPLDCTCESCP